MFVDWQIKSLVSDVFVPRENPLYTFVDATQNVMNSNTVLIKGEIDHSLSPEDAPPFFSFFIRNHFLDLFFEYDRLSQRYDYHFWEDTESSRQDFFKGYKPRAGSLIKSHIYLKKRPISYLGFIEKLHWMLRTSFSPYHTHVKEEQAQKLIADFVTVAFSDETWNFDNLPKVWKGIPNWIPHSWNFYDVVPDFLENTGYWEHNDNAPELSYFDGGDSDSCTFFYKEKVFYLLLTNGSP